VDDAARLIGVGGKALRGYIRELQEKGLVETKRRGQGRTNQYTVHVPDGRNGSIKNGQNDRSGTVETTDPRARATMDDGSDVSETPTDHLPDRARTRKPDVVFDALAEATNSDPHLEGGLIGKEVAKLRKHPDYLAAVEQFGKESADAQLALVIPMQAEAYRNHFGPDIELTAPALVKHWKRVRQPKQGRNESIVDRVMDDLREERHGA
jgi:hypothetical protein